MFPLPCVRPFLLSALLVFTGFSAASAAMSRVNVTVRMIDVSPKTQPAKGKKDVVKKETESRKLSITIRNISKDNLDGLQVKYYFFGHAVGNTTVKVLSEGEEAQTLAPGAQAMVESKAGTAIFTPAYTTKPKKDSKDRPERVKAEGDKLSGWAVRVFAGDTLEAEAYSTPAMKDALPAPGQPEAAAATPAATAAPK